MESITFEIDKETHEKLISIAARSGYSVDEWLKVFIKEYVDAMWIIR